MKTDPAPDRSVFTTGQIDEQFCVSVRSVERWVDAYGLPCDRRDRPRAHRRIAWTDLIDFFARCDLHTGRRYNSLARLRIGYVLCRRTRRLEAA